MNSIDLLRSLERYSVFNLATIETLTELESASAKVRLYRLKKKTYIKEVQRNTYTVHKDPLIVASRIVWPSYISLWYALNHHGITHQVPHEITVLTPKRLFRDEIMFMGAMIRFELIAPTLMFGYEKIIVDGKEVFMASPEKALLDAVILKKISMGEIIDILKSHVDDLDIDVIIQFILRAENKALAKRIGYVLEKMGFDPYEITKHLIYKTPIRLDYALDRDGPMDDRWGIIDNSGGWK